MTSGSGLPASNLVGTVVRTRRGTRFDKLVTTRLGAITFIVPNLATPMTLSISSRVGRLLVLLEIGGLGEVGIPKRGWGSLFIRNGLGWLPFTISFIQLIFGPCFCTNLF